MWSWHVIFHTHLTCRLESFLKQIRKIRKAYISVVTWMGIAFGVVKDLQGKNSLWHQKTLAPLMLEIISSSSLNSTQSGWSKTKEFILVPWPRYEWSGGVWVSRRLASRSKAHSPGLKKGTIDQWQRLWPLMYLLVCLLPHAKDSSPDH